MKAMALTLLLPLALCLTGLHDIELEIDFVLPKSYIEKKQQEARDNPSNRELMLDEIFTPSKQMRPFVEEEIAGISYVIAYDEKSSKVKYILTHDESFRTEVGLKVGDCVTYAEEQLAPYTKWNIRGPETKDGWYPELGKDFFTSTKISTDGKCWVITGFSKGD
jgi:hypothetical protein